MVVYGEGGYRCPEDGPVRPGPRQRAALEAGRFEPRCPRCGRDLVPELVSEDAPLDPRNSYAATKLQQEYLAAVWTRQTGGTAAALRFHNVYGPGMPQDTPYAGVAAIFRSALRAGRAPTVLEDGGQRRDFVHVRDVAAAVLRAAGAIRSAGSMRAGSVRAYNIGSGEVSTIGRLAEVMARVCGGAAPVVSGGYRLGDVRHITASSERAARELGWCARIPFEQGIAELAGVEPVAAG
jgi:dTDP-L-rhamnose 4-epimerase